MKKVTGFLLSALLLFPLSANAAVDTKVDQSGTTTYISQVNFNGPWDSVKLKSAKEKSLPTITLSLADPSYLKNPTYYLFSDKTQLLIDGAVSNLKLVDTYRDRASDLGVFEFTPTQIASIQNAKKVSLQVSFYNKSNITWKLSEKLLNEWKEVLTKGQNKVSLHSTSMDKNMHAM
jgi:hypothetical protein